MTMAMANCSRARSAHRELQASVACPHGNDGVCVFCALRLLALALRLRCTSRPPCILSWHHGCVDPVRFVSGCRCVLVGRHISDC